MKRYVRLFTIAMLCIGLSGCSVYMAAKQPSKKDMSVLYGGTPRKAVIGELGKPAETWRGKDGSRHDIYNFVQGYSKVNKTSRVVVHGVADVMTLGLWEIVGTPTEMIFDGERVSVEITYDRNDLVKHTEIIQGSGK